MVDNSTQANSNIGLNTNDTTSQIFDKVVKRLLQGGVSKAAVIDFVNGLYSENFPPTESELTHLSTENVDGNLKRTLADIIISIKTDGHVRRFHLEAQTDDDHIIVIRVFEYGFRDALRHKFSKGNRITLPFPTPAIIFLEHTDSTPDEVILELDFGKHGKIDYPVRIMKFLKYSIDELCEKRMTILLPLYLLKLRREVENAKRRKHNREETLKQKAKEVKTLIEDGLLPAIVSNEQAGHITHNDAFELLTLLERLYNYLYGNIKEFKDEEASAMTALSDIIELRYDKELEAARREIAIEVAKETACRIAQGLKNLGLSNDMIVTATGLTYDEIEAL